MKKKPLLVSLGLLLIGQFATSIYAADLLDVWKAAQENDHQYLSSKIEQQVGQQRRAQADALWKPQVMASAIGGWGNANTTMTGAQFSAPGMGTVNGANFSTSVNSGALGRYEITAIQPLYSKERDAQKKQLSLAGNVSDIQAQAQHQDLILQVSERYFDVLASQEMIRSTEKLLGSLQRTLGETSRRQSFGDATATDTQEIRAKIESTKAHLVDLQAQLENKQLVLQDLLGKKESLKDLKTFNPNAIKNPGNLEQLRDIMSKKNPRLQMLAAQNDMTVAEAEKYRAESAPTVNAIAQSAYQRLVGTGDFGSSSLSTSNNVVGIQVNVPLYTGGYRSSKLEETLRLADKGKVDLNKANLDMERNLRKAWLAVNHGPAKIKALETTLQTSQARLNATRQGHSVGSKTTLELLGAEIDANQAGLNLYLEKVQMVLNNLRIQYWSGQLSEDDLSKTNAMLR